MLLRHQHKNLRQHLRPLGQFHLAQHVGNVAGPAGGRDPHDGETVEDAPAAQFHGLKVGSIADLIAYRLRNDRIVERTIETTLDTVHGGTFKMMVYVNRVAYAEHIALVKGDIADDGPVLVRMHALNVLDDVIGDAATGKAGEFQNAMRMIDEEGRGVLVLIREPHPTALSDRVGAKLAAKKGNGGEKPTARPGELRDYGVGAQILLDLGVKDMILLSNTRHTIIGLEGYGLSVVDQRPIKGAKGK